ncbi:hypothetical protein M8997_000655 [Phyllobacterium sp. 21LDTY02-6]|uniref:hypothetical protein n=1 Tax=Phyllobacterium sp. 21LDTY02-6 TaxID=2944903 RepID=UPI00202035E2|nr:hypothetical protein [Phyllobacterium sp. 21LDTY02-6]MCO4315676.1 hypothetical protein [Phyllobacterium sp. 21LDTY02-6]
MIRIIVIGLWVCGVALGSLYFAVRYNSASASNPAAVETVLDNGKTDIFSVPIIVDGAVQGYIVSQLIYTLDGNANQSAGAPVSFFINDEIFRQFYGRYSEVKDVQKVEFDDVRKSIIERVNTRFPRPVLRDLLVEQFNYISSNDIRNQNMKGLPRG